MKNRIYILIFAFLLPIICYAQEIQPYSGRVSVSISANDNIKGQIESYISRELRSLGDVIVTDDNPDWVLHIVALEPTSKGGNKVGIILSVVITRPFKSNGLNVLLIVLREVKKNEREILSSMTADLNSIASHEIRVGSPEDLRNMCNSIVADFDTDQIKPFRESWLEMQDIVKQNEKTSPNKAN